MNDTTTITILKSAREEFGGNLEKLNKKLRRIKGAGQSSIIKEEEVEITRMDCFDKPFTLPGLQMTVALPELAKQQGFSFMGVVSLTDGVRTIFATDEGESSGFDFNNVGNTCDHCGHNRQRNKVFVFRKDDGSFIRVGSTCVKEFFGLNIEAILKVSSKILEACNDIDEMFEGWRTTGFSRHELFGAIISLWRRDSVWFSRTKAEQERCVGSADTIFGMLGRHGKEITANVKEGILKAMEEVSVEELTNKIEQTFSSELAANATTFEMNVANALFQGQDKLAEFFPFKTVGLVGWAAFKALNGDVDKKKAAPSQWVGNAGDKVNLTCKVEKLRSVESGFGTSLMVFFKCGNDVVKTFSTARWTDNIQEGDEVKVTGTVKRREDWNGHKSTLLTRCKVIK